MKISSFEFVLILISNVRSDNIIFKEVIVSLFWVYKEHGLKWFKINGVGILVPVETKENDISKILEIILPIISIVVLGLVTILIIICLKSNHMVKWPTLWYGTIFIQTNRWCCNRETNPERPVIHRIETKFWNLINLKLTCLSDTVNVLLLPQVTL